MKYVEILEILSDKIKRRVSLEKVRKVEDESILDSYNVLMTDTFQKFSDQKEVKWREVNNLGLSVKKPGKRSLAGKI